jgi:hypothetical protein
MGNRPASLPSLDAARMQEIRGLLTYESSISFQSGRAHESMWMLFAAAQRGLDPIATVQADALREAAQAQRQLAAQARTSNGRAEHEDRADWLDDQANAIDPRRLEGARP